MTLAIQFCLAVVVGFVSAAIASRRGRNPFFWFAIGALFGILGLAAVFIIPVPSQKEKAPSAPAPYINGPVDCFWYYLDESQRQHGPMSHNALTEAWKKGAIPATTLVWHENLPGWKELQELIK